MNQNNPIKIMIDGVYAVPTDEQLRYWTELREKHEGNHSCFYALIDDHLIKEKHSKILSCIMEFVKARHAVTFEPDPLAKGEYVIHVTLDNLHTHLGVMNDGTREDLLDGLFSLFVENQGLSLKRCKYETPTKMEGNNAFTG